jgi:hypothetical protein
MNGNKTVSATFIAGSTTWQTSGSNVYYNGGKVGIGTSNPLAPFEIGGTDPNTLRAVLARLAEGNAVGEGTFLGVRSYVTQPASGQPCCNVKSFAIEHAFFGNLNSSINFYRGASYTGGFIKIAVDDGTEKFLFNSSGLTVNGKILATEVEVVSSIASDYVFEPEYQLMPLTELEIYLKQNKHLPDIPSAAEFSEKGQNLAKTDDMLLRKIEELTLYIIRQEKTVSEQQKAIDALRIELESLKKK